MKFFREFGLVLFVALLFLIPHELGHYLMILHEYKNCDVHPQFGVNKDSFFVRYDVNDCFNKEKDFKVLFAGFWMETVVDLTIILILLWYVLNKGKVSNELSFILIGITISLLLTFLIYINPFHITSGDMLNMIRLVR